MYKWVIYLDRLWTTGPKIYDKGRYWNRMGAWQSICMCSFSLIRKFVRNTSCLHVPELWRRNLCSSGNSGKLHQNETDLFHTFVLFWFCFQSQGKRNNEKKFIESRHIYFEFQLHKRSIDLSKEDIKFFFGNDNRKLNNWK